MQTMSHAYDLLWWTAACGGDSYIGPKIGVIRIALKCAFGVILLPSAMIAETIYLKYMHGVANLTRIMLFLVLGFLKRYPKQGQFEYLCPRGVSLGDRQVRYLVQTGIKPSPVSKIVKRV